MRSPPTSSTRAFLFTRPEGRIRTREPCLRVLEAVAGGELEAVTDSEVIQEIAYRYHAIGRIADGREVAESFLEAVETVLPVTRQEAMRFLALQHTYAFLPPATPFMSR